MKSYIGLDLLDNLGFSHGKITNTFKINDNLYDVEIFNEGIYKKICLTELELDTILKMNIINTRKNILEKRKITEIVHFTRIENLESILDEGLLSKNILNDRGINFLQSDSERKDGLKDYICSSFSFPNYQMFYQKSCNNQEQWVILRIDPFILINKLDSLFFQSNAASDIEKYKSRLIDRTSNDSLENMFLGPKRSIDIPDYYTSDPQAEILIKDSISPDDIFEVNTINSNDMVRSLAKNSDITYRIRPKQFKYRKDWSMWKRGI